MDPNYRNQLVPGDSKNPGEHADYHPSKEQDIERLDSGIDSYVPSYDSVQSLNSIQTSGYISLERTATQLSSLSVSSRSSTTQSIGEQRRMEDFDKSEIAEDRLDSGIDSIGRSRSVQEDSCHQKEIVQERRPQDPEPADILQWYLPDKDGDTYLQLAIIQKEMDISFNMIQMCSIPEILDIANKEKQSALHLSVISDLPEITRCLVAYGADVRCKDQQGNTPLHSACEQGLLAHVEMLTARLDPEEDPGFQKFSLPQDVNERNYLGFTPLHLAAIGGHLPVVDMLVNQLRCDVDMGDLKSGRTALHHAVERRNIDVIKEILRSGADVDALTYDECSPLHLAAARGLRKEAQLLLDNRADLFLITRDDNDVFELAENSLRVYKVLRDAEKKYKEHRGSLHSNVVMG